MLEVYNFENYPYYPFLLLFILATSLILILYLATINENSKRRPYKKFYKLILEFKDVISKKGIYIEMFETFDRGAMPRFTLVEFEDLINNSLYIDKKDKQMITSSFENFRRDIERSKKRLKVYKAMLVVVFAVSFLAMCHYLSSI